MGIPWLCLIPPSPQLHLGLSTSQLHPGSLPPQLCPGPSSLWLLKAPSSHRFHLGQSLSHHHCGFLGCLLRCNPPPLRLCRTPSSLRLHGGTRSHQHCFGPPPSGSTSVTRRRDCALVPVSINAAGSLGSLDFAWDSPSPRLTSVGLAQVSTMAPPSFSSTVGHLPHGCLPLCTGLWNPWILPQFTPPWALPQSTPPWSL